MEKSTSSSRYSPYQNASSSRQQTREQNQNAPAKVEVAAAVSKDITDAAIVHPEQAYYVDDSVSPMEIGQYVSNMGLQTNFELMGVLPDLTNDINSVDVVDVLSANLSATNVRNTMAGLCVIVNRLLQDNKFLIREMHALKAGAFPNNLARLERYEFRKRLIKKIYFFAGCEGIPPANLNEIVERFDQTNIRRGENGLSSVRRFVRFVLEALIPPENQTKFTVRERGGQDHLTELPNDLLLLIRDMCLEALGLAEARTEEERVRREDFADFITRAVKSSLQEMRRNPRKPKTYKQAPHE